MTIAAGSQLWAAVILILPALCLMPAQAPRLDGWISVALLAIACTGLAYILYFRLIASAGPTNAISVTFLIPVFGMLWSAWFLGEPVTLRMIAARHNLPQCKSGSGLHDSMDFIRHFV